MNVAAVLLAAGASSRFGEDNKLLSLIDGEPLVRRAARSLRESRVGEIVAVTGRDRDAIAGALAGLDIVFATNDVPESGMGRSIAAGVAALGSDPEGAFIVPGDMQALSPALLDRLIGAFEEAGKTTIVYPELVGHGQRNPVLWPRAFFPDLLRLDGEAGAKGLLASAGASAIAVAFYDARPFVDIDTDADLAGYRARKTYEIP